jgi:serine/threonine protein kinase
MPNDKRRTINTELLILSTIGPLGHRLPNRRTTMTIKQLVQIMRGVFQCLWFCASKGIHYRDLNLGNIVFLPVPGSKDDMTGFLIDFGNARYLDKPRSLHGQPASHDKSPLIQKDDHVSSTLLYRSTNLSCDESTYYSGI